MIVSIEDEAAEAAEVANLMSARRNSQVAAGLGRNGYSYENRRMSKVSKRSHRSSIGAGSVNGQGPSPGAMNTTTTAEVSHPCCQSMDDFKKGTRDWKFKPMLPIYAQNVVKG